MLVILRFMRIGLVLVIVVLITLACGNHTNSTLDKKTYTRSPIISNSVTKATLNKKFLEQVNKLRAQDRKCGDKYFASAPPLTMNDRLTLAASQHSSDMYQNNFLDHISSNGDTLADRIEKVNYKWRVIGENVAHNQRKIEQVLQDWLSSPGHCRNMMSSEYRHTGIAQVNWYWTQVYAAPK